MQNEKDTSLQDRERQLVDAMSAFLELMMDDIHARSFAAHLRAQDLLKSGAEVSYLFGNFDIPRHRDKKSYGSKDKNRRG